jgi:hypothetical protein
MVHIILLIPFDSVSVSPRPAISDFDFISKDRILQKEKARSGNFGLD